MEYEVVSNPHLHAFTLSWYFCVDGRGNFQLPMKNRAQVNFFLRLQIYFHNAWIEPDGHCSIGLKPIASIPLMTYDFIINLYMTVLFVRPLMKIESDNNGGWRESRLRDVAKRTMVASMVCLIVSFANVCALTILHGYEPGVICLTCCFVDVMINVCTVHWVTTQRTKKGARHTAIQPELSEDSKAVPTITTQTSQSDASQEKKKQQQQRYRFDPLTQQYGEFGHSAWPSADISDYHPTVYMSATGNTIHTSPVTAYQPQHIQNKDNQLPSLQPPAVSSNILGSSTPISYHYVNGRFVMITDKDDDDTHSSSQSSCIQDPSSSQSLTIASSDSSRTRVD
ncbi:hypothetical protein DM01DRAFT_1198452 [Hesseltinella vesiculosa]|uniref:Transmembrane protein n=1 Tax=Hesseltinella vesiculosa TaxID=101127 RepID=A0A1X2G395_9FUNG|nr:hypothetical protein DM01DRAFT_1198452 [Hesseltinella vesiculosa]